TILEACRKHNPKVKIIFAGTRGQYGRAKYLPVDENHLMCPIDVNGINNVAGEAYHIVYHQSYGIRAVSLRLTNTYGPRHQMRHSRQGFLNWFIRLAVDDEKITIFGEGKQLRDFNYVDDVVRAFLLAAATEKTNGEVYNLGSGKPVSVAEATKLIVKIAGTGKVEFVPFPKDKAAIEIGDYYADYTKFRQALGWQPQVSLEEGLEKTIKFYRQFKKHYWDATEQL
ncbi:MAG: NAD-dependent epimerase/dehydratase family protein, partial [Candidatus Omnitrophota bacterium]